MDLVAANYYSASISILFQNSSSPGTFLAAQNLGVGVYPNEVAIGDLNGDGYLDIAVADSGQAIGGSLLFQNAGAPGTFFPRISLGVHCTSVGIGDLNEDGRADLVCTGTDTGNVSILLQSPAGAGTFLPPQTVAAGVQPSNVAIADLNADGLPRPCDCESMALAFQTVHLRAASPSSLTIRPLREVFWLRPTTLRDNALGPSPLEISTGMGKRT